MSRSLICQVSLNQPIVLELEFYTVLVLEIFLISIHQLQKVLLEARLEVKVLRNFVRNIWQIKKYHNNVWLLTVVIIVVIIISDKFFSFVNMGANVAECLWVVGIAQNTVPRSTLNRLFWHCGHIKNTNNSWIFNFNAVVFLKILGFFHNLVSLLQSDCCKKVWKIFINHNIFCAHGKSPCLELICKYYLRNSNKNWGSSHNQNWCCPVDFNSDKNVLRGHAINRS